MAERIYLLNDKDDDLVALDEASYDSESLLQQLLAKHCDLLSGEQIDADDPRRWLLVTREMSVPGEEGGPSRWSLDHLFLDQDGIPTLVEVKRSSDTRIRREVIGQMLDYAANAVSYWPVEEIKAKFEARCDNDDLDPADELVDLVGSDHDVAEFWQSVKTNLQAGRVRMIFIADEIPSELRRIVEFLNGQMDPAEVLAIEIKQFLGEGVKTLVPRVLGQNKAARKKKVQGGKGRQRLDMTIDGKLYEALPRRMAIFTLVKHLCNRGISPEEIDQCVPWRRKMFRSVNGEVSSEEFRATTGVESSYFCSDDELLRFNGRTYALSSGWGSKTEQAIQDILSRFPYKGVTFQKCQE